MSLTIDLLRFIGSPYLPSTSTGRGITDWLALFKCAVKNRLPYLYLDTARYTEAFDSVRETYKQYSVEFRVMFEAVARISTTLTKAGVKHALFKTLRPYISTTVDIDVIVFGSFLDYKRAIEVASRAGYRRLASDKMSTTFRTPKVKISVDLYNEVAVSRVPYIDKWKIADEIITTELPSRERVKTLTPEADLLSIIAHSIIKENLYTLSEYYTYVYYVNRLNIDRFVHLAQETHLTHATKVHTAITALLYKVAYGTLPHKLQLIINKIGSSEFETGRLIKNDFKTPHKYHIATIARSLVELTRENKALIGLADQVIHSFNASFSKDFLSRLSVHATRETY